MVFNCGTIRSIFLTKTLSPKTPWCHSFEITLVFQYSFVIVFHSICIIVDQIYWIEFLAIFISGNLVQIFVFVKSAQSMIFSFIILVINRNNFILAVGLYPTIRHVFHLQYMVISDSLLVKAGVHFVSLAIIFHPVSISISILQPPTKEDFSRWIIQGTFSHSNPISEVELGYFHFFRISKNSFSVELVFVHSCFQYVASMGRTNVTDDCFIQFFLVTNNRKLFCNTELPTV